MNLVAIVAALVLEQWRPVGALKSYQELLARWADWLERSFNGGEARHGLIAWVVAVLPVLAAALAAYYLLLAASPLKPARACSGTLANAEFAQRSTSTFCSVGKLMLPKLIPWFW